MHNSTSPLALMLRPGWASPVWNKPGEGEGGSSTDGGADGGSEGSGVGDDTGIGNADDQSGDGGGDGGDAGDDGIALDGGTAEGQGNSDEGNGEGDKDGDGGDDDESGAPEEYDFSTMEMPEGITFDEGMAEAMSPAMREANLTQEQANVLARAYAEQMAAQAEASAQGVKDLLGGWVKKAKADKEIGLNNWGASVDAANAVIRQFGTPELVSEVMVGQGMGNHPEVIRFISRIGKAIGDDQLITGENTDTGGDVPAEEVWYGNTTPTTRKG